MTQENGGSRGIEYRTPGHTGEGVSAIGIDATARHPEWLGEEPEWDREAMA